MGLGPVAGSGSGGVAQGPRHRDCGSERMRRNEMSWSVVDGAIGAPAWPPPARMRPTVARRRRQRFPDPDFALSCAAFADLQFLR